MAEELARGLYSFNGRDLSVELEELRQHVVGVENKRAAEAVQLLWLVMENLRCPGRPRHVPHLGHPSTTEVSPGSPDGGKHYFRASMGGTCLWLQSLGLKLSPSGVATAPGYPTCNLFCTFGTYVRYISIFLHM
jgi:hypothetical protein